MFLSRSSLGTRVARFLTSIDALSPADAIVVLGGDSTNFSRVQQAVHLFHQGYAPTVVFCIPFSKDAHAPSSTAQQKIEVARRLGLPADAALLTHGVRSTYDEAVNLRQLVHQHGWRSLIVVTDPFHTRRVGRTFRTLLPDATIYLNPSPNPTHDARRWWRTRDGTVFVVREMAKIAFYWVRYGVVPIG